MRVSCLFSIVSLAHSTSSVAIERNIESCQLGSKFTSHGLFFDESMDTSQEECGLPGLKGVNGKKTVRFYFIRHAESKWNEVKATLHGQLSPRQLVAAGQALTVKDARLTSTGIKQLIALRTLIGEENGFGVENEEHRKLLMGAIPYARAKTIAYLTSNLRRAALSLLVVMEKRLRSTGLVDLKLQPITEIGILSSLQETTNGLDARSWTKPGGRPVLSGADKSCTFNGVLLNTLFDAKCNFGDQTPKETENRLEDFCKYILKESMEKTDFVVAGHSEWLFDFFTRFLPADPPGTEVGVNDVESTEGKEVESTEGKEVGENDVEITEGKEVGVNDVETALGEVRSTTESELGKAGEAKNPTKPAVKRNEVEISLTTRNSKGKKQKLGNAGVVFSQLELDYDRMTCLIVPGSTVKLTTDVLIKASSGGE